MDCTSRLLSVCFTDSEIAKNFHSARTKTERIITGVLAPLSIEEVLAELKSGIKFSLSTDASNHAELKTFPIIIRYFNQDGIQNKLLDFVHLEGEKAQQVTDMLLEVISKNQLNIENMIAFCADNAPVNFGGVNRSGRRECFYQVNVYGDSAPSYATVKNWAGETRRGRVRLQDEPRPGRPIEVTTEKKVDKVRKMLEEDRRITVREIADDSQWRSQDFGLGGS